ncbi:MAG: type IV pilin protein [Candidatus Avelusimicrobium sp.]|uniref:type IV pilin protein n=1 Tax=Candidatus Avelusimicrobium sp. TaxID=3048833 RepID=UPI003F0BBE50
MQKNAGFTLIELLVVVLIIGILAAVALPQYQVAVEKARIAKLMPVVKALKDSAELYYMENGRYDDSADGLATEDLAGCTVGVAGHVNCSDSWFNMLTNTPGLYNVGGYSGKKMQSRVGYQLGLDNGPHAGMVWCLASASDEVANKVCKSMGGISAGSGSESGMKGTAVKIYRLP